MKKLLLVCLLALGTSVMSFAQGGPGGGGRTPEAQLERLKGAVTGITADQSTKILAIYAASTKKSDSIRTAAGDDMQSAFPKMQEVRTAASAKVKALLTADQQKQFDAMPQGRGGFGGGAPGGAPGGGVPRP